MSMSDEVLAVGMKVKGSYRHHFQVRAWIGFWHCIIKNHHSRTTTLGGFVIAGDGWVCYDIVSKSQFVTIPRRGEGVEVLRETTGVDVDGGAIGDIYRYVDSICQRRFDYANVVRHERVVVSS